MWKFAAHGALLALLLCLPGHTVGAQSAASEPFTSVETDKMMETNATQSQRLKAIRELPTTQSVHLLRMNESVPIGEKLKITVPNEKTFILSKTGGETRDSKDFTWFGVVQGESNGSATLAARHGEISGSINSMAGVYRLSPLGDGLYALVKIDERKLPPDEPPSKDVKKQ
jgi:hypothetical protein